MLGRFLEFSLATPDIQESLNFYLKIGFSEAQVGETWRHPYAVVTDGRICLGLHQNSTLVPTLTFVKPELLKHMDALEKLGVEFEYRHLGSDIFNEVGFFDPSGQAVRLIEARTFSPSKRVGTGTSQCGYFLEFALPCPNRERAKAYWENLGFVGMEEWDHQLPHTACTSDHIEMGLYAPTDINRPTLRFEVDGVAGTLARLAESGVAPTGVLPAVMRSEPAALLVAPEGTPILLTSAAA